MIKFQKSVLVLALALPSLAPAWAQNYPAPTIALSGPNSSQYTIRGCTGLVLGADTAPVTCGGTLPPEVYQTVPFPSSFGSTPTSSISQNIGSYPTGGMIPAGVLQGYLSAMVVPGTYEQEPWPNTNFAAYGDNQNGHADGSSLVNYFGLALADGGGNSSAYGGNFILSNTDPLHAFSGVGQGKDFSLLVGQEIDINIWKNGASTPAGEVDAFRFVTGGEVTSAGNTSTMHIVAGSTPWTFGLKTEAGAVLSPIDLGALSTGNNQVSQPINLRSKDSGGTDHLGVIQLDANGAIDISGTGLSVFTSSGEVFKVDVSGNFKTSGLLTTAQFTPTSGSQCAAGTFSSGNGFIYVCGATDVWQQVTTVDVP